MNALMLALAVRLSGTEIVLPRVLLGAAAGCLIVLVLCWAILRFAPVENVGLLSQHCLKQSQIGTLILPLFAGLTL